MLHQALWWESILQLLPQGMSDSQRHPVKSEANFNPGFLLAPVKKSYKEVEFIAPSLFGMVSDVILQLQSPGTDNFPGFSPKIPKGWAKFFSLPREFGRVTHYTPSLSLDLNTKQNRLMKINSWKPDPETRLLLWDLIQALSPRISAATERICSKYIIPGFDGTALFPS